MEGCNKLSGGKVGLQIKCNTFATTKNDITVWPDVNSSTIGIAKYLGMANAKLCEQLAGNSFSQSNNQYHIYNGPHDGLDRLEYNYFGSDLSMQPVRIYRVNANGVNPSSGGECCPAHIYGGGGTTSLDQQTIDYKSDYSLVESQLDSLIDQGNTDQKLFSISTAYPDEGLIITSDLLQTSPYLSDTVIKKTIEREDVITNSMLRDVMVANPHSAKSVDLISHLDTRLNPMPEYMVEEILEGQLIQSEREIKEALLSLNKRAYTYGFNRQLASLLSDSLISIVDSVNKLLDADGEFNSLLKMSWVHLEEGDTLTALSNLNELDTLTLDHSQRNELNSQQEFMEWLSAYPVFDTTQIENLENFGKNSSHKISASALGILLANGVSDYHEPYSVIDFSKSSDPVKVKEKRSNENYLTVNPNPAKDYIIVKYAGEMDSFSLYIYNEQGRMLLKKKMIKHKNEITLSTIDLKPGVYLLQLRSEKGSVESAKFIISN